MSPGGPVSSTRGQEGEQADVGVCRVLNDPLGLPEVPLGVKLLQAGQLAPGDVLGRAHHPFQRLTVHVGAAAVPGGEAACQEALNGALVEVPEDLWFQSESLESPQSVQSLLGLPDYSDGVGGPCQVLIDVDTQVFKGVHTLHRCAVDGDWG